MHQLLVLAGTIGIAGVFLPFASDVTPWGAIADKNFWNLAEPLFLAFVIPVAQLRWLVKEILPKVEREIYAITGLVSGGLVFWSWIQLIIENGLRFASVADYLALILPLVVMLAGTTLAARCEHGKRPVIWLETVYVANSAMCLVGFWPYWEIGAYCAAIASVIYLLQAILMAGQIWCPANGSRKCGERT